MTSISAQEFKKSIHSMKLLRFPFEIKPPKYVKSYDSSWAGRMMFYRAQLCMLWTMVSQNLFLKRQKEHEDNEAQNRFDIIKIKYIFIDFHNVLQRKAHKRNNIFPNPVSPGGGISHNIIRDKNQQIRVLFYFTAHKFPPNRDPFTKKVFKKNE